MITNFSRHTFQFNLRTLLIAISLCCLLLARLAYLRQCAVFHEKQAEHYAISIEQRQKVSRKMVDVIEAKWSEVKRLKIFALSSVEVATDEDGLVQVARVDDDVRRMHHHRLMAAAYQSAVFRPWKIIDETMDMTPIIEAEKPPRPTYYSR